MQSQRWMFMSPGGENEYKRPSVTREHYSAVIQEILRNKSAETDNGTYTIMYKYIHNINFVVQCAMFILFYHLPFNLL